MTNPWTKVAGTAALVAAVRARESARPDGLFDDPFAQRLAGPAGLEMLERMVARVGPQSTTQIVVRTRFWDEALLRAAPVCRQVVLLAAGLDARAFRLPWPAAVTVFEVDQPAVIEAKAALLAGEPPRCTRIPVGTDLTADWPTVLVDAGLNPAAPTAWLVEGLLQYLTATGVGTLFARLDALSAPGSVLLYDVVGRSLLDAPVMADLRRTMDEQGAPWLFGTDDPGALAGRLGWTTRVTDVAEPGYAWGRWHSPPAPAGVAGTPRGYFVEAVKPNVEPLPDLPSEQL
ncbi:SAM-dependent methyltransferase [Mycobacterium sp. Y57]|uniref:SAM-dependent methyltransferase n=1 Tax=Mycolicibacterium xanthum TaxID=2796469 RepID=UPI001C84CF4B|nr:SAM-dependent methyltransferase [Mycolicibacterium xanthum]MBX7432495.1 SAM-dependent methyltransferase [Mycolicibacterium xanthum]